MLEREGGDAKIFGFLVGVEIQQDLATIDEVAIKLADAARFVEGVGDVTVDVLGEVEVVEGTAEPLEDGTYVGFPVKGAH